MDRDELITLLQKLPPGTRLSYRSGDDAWPLAVRVFQEGSIAHAYIVATPGDHRNFPEGVRGIQEITREILGT